MPETPEQNARREIDADLTSAGRRVQSREDLRLAEGRGPAGREFAMKCGFGFADSLVDLDRKAIGAVEVRSGALSGGEAKYATGLPDNLPAHRWPLPFLFESKGAVTYLSNGLDPIPRSRQVFNFPRAECLAGDQRPNSSLAAKRVLSCRPRGDGLCSDRICL